MKSISLFMPGRLCLFGEHTDWAGTYMSQNSEVVEGQAIVTGINLGIYADAFANDKFKVSMINDNALMVLSFSSILSVISSVFLIAFFISTFILFLAFWYFISAFSAVYQNTQIIYIKDFLLSFILGLIYPIVLYIFPSILRIISLRACKKVNLSFVYKLSDIIPIF